MVDEGVAKDTSTADESVAKGASTADEAVATGASAADEAVDKGASTADEAAAKGLVPSNWASFALSDAAASTQGGKEGTTPWRHCTATRRRPSSRWRTSCDSQLDIAAVPVVGHPLTATY